ncbi:MAG: hypothetical protein AAF456_03855 [Planctomycetota bacterium]
MKRSLVASGALAMLSVMLLFPETVQAQRLMVEQQAESAPQLLDNLEFAPAVPAQQGMCEQGIVPGGMFAQSGFPPPQQEGDEFIDGVSMLMAAFERPMPVLQMLVAILQQILGGLTEASGDGPAPGGAGGTGGFGSGARFAPQQGG